ncbi:hypothetical protein C8R46DRAFT_1037202 [Mycena filopes]|nr:hypothetical protein C8R46DRAFT_1037202 [Mycena filopes]
MAMAKDETERVMYAYNAYNVNGKTEHMQRTGRKKFEPQIGIQSDSEALGARGWHLRRVPAATANGERARSWVVVRKAQAQLTNETAKRERGDQRALDSYTYPIVCVILPRVVIIISYEVKNKGGRAKQHRVLICGVFAGDRDREKYDPRKGQGGWSGMQEGWVYGRNKRNERIEMRGRGRGGKGAAPRETSERREAHRGGQSDDAMGNK